AVRGEGTGGPTLGLRVLPRRVPLQPGGAHLAAGPCCPHVRPHVRAAAGPQRLGRVRTHRR
ncbi:hypothetical protein ISCGN_005886, partial [Ixodes scapularis]